MRSWMDSIEQRISRIEARLDETNKRIDTLTLDMNRRFEDMAKRIESINADCKRYNSKDVAKSCRCKECYWKH